MGPDKAWGPNKIWGPGINLCTPCKIFSLRPCLGVMFKVKQLFTKNYLLLLHITPFLVHFNSFKVIRFEKFKRRKKLSQ